MVSIVLLLSFAGLNVWDMVLTGRVLARGGRELNPVVRTFGIIPVKAVAVLVAGVAAWQWGWRPVAAMDLVMLGVCLWNVRQLKKP